MSKRYYLYKFEDNWADEADFSGFAVFTEEEKRMHEAGIKKAFKNGGSICFGTNEDNDYDSYEDVESTFSFEEITKQEYFTIKRLFGETFGHLGPLDELGSYEGDDDEDEEEEDTCEVCGDYDDTGSGTCSECIEDEEVEELVEDAKTKLEKEFGIELSEKGKYKWKPTPVTTIEISIGDNDGFADIMLFKGRSVMEHEYFDLELKDIVKEVKKIIKIAQNL